MKRNIILGIIIILLHGIFAGSCIPKQNPAGNLEKENTASDKMNQGEIGKADEEFYDKLKDIIKKAGIIPYETPLEAHYQDFTLENLAGKKVSLSDFDEQTKLLNFWATWCGPCIREMPSMEELYRELKDEGFVIVAVDVSDSKEIVQKYVTKAGLTFPILLDKTGEIGSIYGASSIPLSYLIDTKGYVVGYMIGSTQWNTSKIKEVIRFIQNRGNE